MPYGVTVGVKGSKRYSDCMQLIVTASDTCADDIKKGPGYRELSIVITTQLLKLQTSNWTCRSGMQHDVNTGKPACTCQRQGLLGAWLHNRMFSCSCRLRSRSKIDVSSSLFAARSTAANFCSYLPIFSWKLRMSCLNGSSCLSMVLSSRVALTPKHATTLGQRVALQVAVHLEVH